MAANEDMLQKVLDTTTAGAGGGGLLNAEQADRFLDYMWDATVLAQDARRIRMKADTVDIDKINIGERIARVATEGVDTGVNENPTFTKVSLTTTKLRLDWELTQEALEDNIAGDDLEDHVARMMATQFGNDVEDLAINGDTGSADPLLQAFDGYHKLALNKAIVVDAAGSNLDKDVFNLGLKAMPRKYLQRRDQLSWYVPSGPIQDFLHGLTDRASLMGDNAIFGTPNGVNGRGGRTSVRPYGIPMVEVPLFPTDGTGDYSGATGNRHGWVDLTWGRNRLWGIKREVKVYREFKPKKDTLEYTVYTRVGVEIENEESYVVIKNVKEA